MQIRHGRVTLKLHVLAQRESSPVLLLHALFGSSAEWDHAAALWPGPLYALDFSGHGCSGWLVGGGYYPELLAGDADAALAKIGSAAVAGAGLGAYVALLLAGARPDLVHAALLLPGAGLTGGGAVPDFTSGFAHLESTTHGHELSYDPKTRALDLQVRPADYAASFARSARRLLFLEDGQARPPWWEAARRTARAESIRGDRRHAFLRLAHGAGTHRPIHP
ncbi:MAG: alpha/beta hydrolase [Candidatus Binatia bacterium]